MSITPFFFALGGNNAVLTAAGANGAAEILFEAGYLPAIGSKDRIRADEQNIRALMQAETELVTGLARGDAEAVSNAGALSRALNHTRRKVLEQLGTPLNSFNLFPVLTDSPPPGARTFSTVYQRSQGEAQWYRDSNTDLKGIEQTLLEDQYKLWPIITSYNSNFFESMTNRFAQSNGLPGLNKEASNLRTARRLIDEKINKTNWFGDDSVGLHGVLNLPQQQKIFATEKFSASGTSATVLDQLNNAGNYVSEQSGNTMGINRVVSSPKVVNYLMQKRLADGTDMTIGQSFLNGRPGVSQIEQAEECARTTSLPGGGSNIHAILFYNDSGEALGRVQPMGVTVLPTFRQALSNITPVGAICGGMVSPMPGTVLVMFVDVSA